MQSLKVCTLKVNFQRSWRQKLWGTMKTCAFHKTKKRKEKASQSEKIKKVKRTLKWIVKSKDCIIASKISFFFIEFSILHWRMESLKDFPKAQLSTIEFQYQTSLLDKSNIEKFEKAHEAAFWHIIYVALAIYCKKLQTRHCGMQAIGFDFALADLHWPTLHWIFLSQKHLHWGKICTHSHFVLEHSVDNLKLTLTCIEQLCTDSTLALIVFWH